MMLNWKDTPLGWHVKVAISSRTDGTGDAPWSSEPWFFDCRATRDSMRIELRDNTGTLLDAARRPDKFSCFEYLLGPCWVESTPAPYMRRFEDYLDTLIDNYVISQVPLP